MTYRRIDTKIWQDPWVESLEPEGKLLFVYLTTNECCNQAGLYQISPKRISFETGLSQQKVKDFIDSLKPKVVVVDNWIWVLNFVRYQSQNDSFLTAAKREAIKAPKNLYDAWFDYNTNHDVSPPHPPFLETDTDTVTETVTVMSSSTQCQDSDSTVEPLCEKSPTAPYTEIIERLNEKTGKHYLASTKSTQNHIKARIKEGHTLEDFMKVIDIKCEKWIGTEWESYLRPETLFGTKFDSYLNESRTSPLKGKLTERGIRNLAATESYLEQRGNDNAGH